MKSVAVITALLRNFSESFRGLSRGLQSATSLPWPLSDIRRVVADCVSTAVPRLHQNVSFQNNSTSSIFIFHLETNFNNVSCSNLNKYHASIIRLDILVKRIFYSVDAQNINPLQYSVVYSCPIISTMILNEFTHQREKENKRKAKKKDIRDKYSKFHFRWFTVGFMLYLP